MSITFGSIFSGIESASVAWLPLGWRCAFTAEIDPFACHVLHQRHGAGRPMFMPDPDAAKTFLEKRARAAAIKAVARAVKATHKGHRDDPTTDNFVIAFGGNNQSGPIDVATAQTAQTAHGGTGRHDFESETFVAHALRAEGFDASEDGSGRGIPLVPVAQGVALRGRDEGGTAELTGEVMTALRTGGFTESHANAGVMPAIAFHARQDPNHGDVTHPLDTDGTSIGKFHRWRVRRLMPVECERLQGFPDGYTDIIYRGKPAADGPRYKAIGNSKAVNCIRWIGEGIYAMSKSTAGPAEQGVGQ